MMNRCKLEVVDQIGKEINAKHVSDWFTLPYPTSKTLVQWERYLYYKESIRNGIGPVSPFAVYLSFLLFSFSLPR
jgi:hypothetical protein